MTKPHSKSEPTGELQPVLITAGASDRLFDAPWLGRGTTLGRTGVPYSMT